MCIRVVQNFFYVQVLVLYFVTLVNKIMSVKFCLLSSSLIGSSTKLVFTIMKYKRYAKIHIIVS